MDHSGAVWRSITHAGNRLHFIFFLISLSLRISVRINRRWGLQHGRPFYYLSMIECREIYLIVRQRRQPASDAKQLIAAHSIQVQVIFGHLSTFTGRLFSSDGFIFGYFLAAGNGFNQKIGHNNFGMQMSFRGCVGVCRFSCWRC